MKRTLLFAWLILVLSTAVYASDINFGATARTMAMGGAGIALGDDASTTAVLNPAAPACAGAKVRFIFPGLDFHTVGASFSDLLDSVDKLGGDEDDALSLVNDFAKQQTGLTFNMVTGFAGPTGLTIEAQANALITPSAEAAKWATAALLFRDTSGVNLSDVQAIIDHPKFDEAITYALAGNAAAADSAFDSYLADLNKTYVDANLVYGPSLLLGRGFDTTNGRMWLGTNIKILSTEGKRWQVKGTRVGSLVASGGKVLADLDFEAEELPDEGRKTTMKADVGLIYKPNDSIWQYGVVVNNFIKPKIRGLTNTQDDPMISVGVAAALGRNFLFAADLVNITGANDDNAKLRFGGEFRLGRLFALRAGYSGSKWTYGAELLGLNIAWSGRSAQLLSNVLKF
ncbi:MAG: conjugal transfer protein TraF [Armatimonadota bacterium]|nr:conjugal transfer protein TraF [Armatimonadota bacterium]